MKKIPVIILLLTCSTVLRAQTWDEWMHQDKTQLKYLREQIVKLQVYIGYVKKGYGIVKDGLTIIGDFKNADLAQHLDKFNRLEKVNPVIQKLSQITEMATLYKKICKGEGHYKNSFREAGIYSEKDLVFIHRLLTAMVTEATTTIDDLLAVTLDGKAAMSDKERINRITVLHRSLQKIHQSFFSFCRATELQMQQRRRERDELKQLQKLY